MKLVVIYNEEGLPLGVFPKKTLDTSEVKRWWSSRQVIDAPEEDWENNKITVDNVHNYL